MKIILSTSPRADSDLERGGLPFLGIGYIASYLKKHNYDAEIKDPHNLNWKKEKTVNEILKSNPDIVGITTTTDNRLKAIEIIRELKKKKPSLIIVTGGPHFALTARNALKKVKEIDYVVKAEAEITMKELADAIKNKKDPTKIKGIFYRDNKGGILETQDREMEIDIDKFPLCWDLFDMDKYHRNIDGTNIRAIGVVSSRGCPNRCAYCVNAAFRKGLLRLRDPIKFVDEVEFLKNKYGFKGFDFWDDTLTISRKHIKTICEEILKRELNIKWYARARVNTVDKELLQLMRKAGCIRISYGVESGSPKILKIIRKNITPEQALKAAELSSEAGITTYLNFMVNLPYETWDDLRMTVDLMKRLRKIKNVYPAYGFTIIYPGTEMEEIAKREGWLPKNFSWNEPYRSEKYKIAGIDPSLPYMEWPGAELERVKAFMARNLKSKNIISKGIKKISKVRSLKELKDLIKTGIRYFKK
ncbi:MAG: radical SAM protein [Candidatus Portnoybacteria bacterium]|nr:radical SAM protein [Candidatus Portnoybacteria bacterium]